MAKGTRAIEERVVTRALVVVRRPIGESDLIVGFYTEACGAIAAVARGALRSSKRFAALEPMHLLSLRLGVSRTRELATLSEAILERPRLGLVSSLAAIEAAGQALAWVRRSAPPREPEPAIWRLLNGLLDGLDAHPDELSARSRLASGGQLLLAASGWELELGRCVSCSRPCPDNARAHVDARAGGIVCRDCGPSGVPVGSRQRAAMARAMQGESHPFERLDDANRTVALIEAAIAAHAEDR